MRERKTKPMRIGSRRSWPAARSVLVMALVGLLGGGAAGTHAESGPPPPATAVAASTPVPTTTGAVTAPTVTVPTVPTPPPAPAAQPTTTIASATATVPPSPTPPGAVAIPAPAVHWAAARAHAAASPHPRRPPLARAAGAQSVTIKDFSFGPAAISVGVGDTVTWLNQGPTDHTATGSSFDTGTLGKGQSASHTFTTAGTFQYHCSLHPFMKGTVSVVASPGRSSSSGATSGAGAGSGNGSSASTGSSGVGPSTAGSGPTLPLTGLDTPALLGLGSGLLLLGLALRRSTRRR
jgi:plastocyanin